MSTTGITARLEDLPPRQREGNARQKVVNFPRVIIRLRGFARLPLPPLVVLFRVVTTSIHVLAANLHYTTLHPLQWIYPAVEIVDRSD